MGVETPNRSPGLHLTQALQYSRVHVHLWNIQLGGCSSQLYNRSCSRCWKFGVWIWSLCYWTFFKASTRALCSTQLINILAHPTHPMWKDGPENLYKRFRRVELSFRFARKTTYILQIHSPNPISLLLLLTLHALEDLEDVLVHGVWQYHQSSPCIRSWTQE